MGLVTNGGCELTRDLHTRTTSVVEGAILMLTCILTVGGNILLWLTVLRYKQLHKSIYVLLLGLSASDLVVGVLNMPLTAYTMMVGRWEFNCTLCKIAGYTLPVAIVTTLALLTMVSINRYVQVCHKRWYPTIYQAKFMAVHVTAPVSFSIVYHIPLAVDWRNIKYIPSLYQCQTISMAYTTADLIYAFIVSGVIVYCNAAIYSKYRKIQRLNKHEDPENVQETSGLTDESGSTNSEIIDEQRQDSPLELRRDLMRYSSSLWPRVTATRLSVIAEVNESRDIVCVIDCTSVGFNSTIQTCDAVDPVRKECCSPDTDDDSCASETAGVDGDTVEKNAITDPHPPRRRADSGRPQLVSEVRTREGVTSETGGRTEMILSATNVPGTRDDIVANRPGKIKEDKTDPDHQSATREQSPSDDERSFLDGLLVLKETYKHSVSQSWAQRFTTSAKSKHYDLHVAMTVMVVVFTFFLTYLPLSVIQAVERSVSIPSTVITVYLVLMYMGFMIRPFIYGWGNLLSGSGTHSTALCSV